MERKGAIALCTKIYKTATAYDDTGPIEKNSKLNLSVAVD